jgi:acyl-CoA oxidase
MAQSQQVKDLAAARAKTSFPVIELTRYIHGSDDKIARRRHLASLISNDPVFSMDKRHVSFPCCCCLHK